MDVRFNQDPDLPDALDITKKETMFDMNCHAIGIVQSFDPAKQTIQATIAYKQTYTRMGDDGQYGDVLVDYPILVDVPVLVLSGGGANLTMPITQGDECLICFNDRNIDNWFAGGGVTQPADDRLHAFADGIALVGVRSLAHSIKNYDATRAVLRNGTASVGVGPTLIQIKNQNQNLKMILTNLITAIKTASTNPVTAGSPAVFNAATMTALDQVSTALGGLLE